MILLRIIEVFNKPNLHFLGVVETRLQDGGQFNLALDGMILLMNFYLNVFNF